MAKLLPPALDPQEVPERSGTGYPTPFRSRVAGRYRRRLGEAAGLKNFGVNLVRLDPGAQSSVRHWHEKQDEFVYVLEGELTLVTDAGRQKLTAGMAAGFAAGRPDGHHLINESGRPAVYLEIGDRTPGDRVEYPDDDLLAREVEGRWVFTHKDGSPWR